MSTKQVIVVRKDLNMRKGKIGAQAAHASLAAVLSMGTKTKDSVVLKLTEAAKEWLSSGSKKICVYVNSEEELLAIYEKARATGATCSLITDKGNTEFNGVPTKTCCAIGPGFSSDIDQVTGSLPLY